MSAYPYGFVDGWPGFYWLEQTALKGDEVPIFDINSPPDLWICNVNDGKLFRTHAIIRALNWWNDLSYALTKSLAPKLP